jgi:hypothetical protein
MEIISKWESLGEVIVEHIITNAQINVNAGIPVATSGSALAQAGSTTAPGNGTIL